MLQNQEARQRWQSLSAVWFLEPTLLGFCLSPLGEKLLSFLNLFSCKLLFEAGYYLLVRGLIPSPPHHLSSRNPLQVEVLYLNITPFQLSVMHSTRDLWLFSLAKSAVLELEVCVGERKWQKAHLSQHGENVAVLCLGSGGGPLHCPG